MDVTKLADEVFDILSGYIARLIDPLAKRLKALEDRPLPEKGDDGESVSEEAVDKMVAARVSASLGAIEQRMALENEAKVARLELDIERRAQETLQRAIDRMPKPKDGEDGEDGIGFDDMQVEHDGKRAVTLKFQKGDIVKSYVINIPAVIDAGFWKAEKEYEVGDGVTDGGSYWIAQKETKTRPEVGNPDWRLAVRKGRDARMESHRTNDSKPVKIGSVP